MNNLKALMQQEVSELKFVGSNFTLSPFNGGTINSSYCLETNGKRYFVKTFESDQIARLDRTSLFNIQKDLANLGLSVAPVYLSEDGRFQIDEWLDAPTLDNADVSALTITKKLATTLATIHSTNMDVPMLDLPSQWRHYIDLLGTRLSDDEQRKIDHYSDIWVQACKEKLVFCHNDLALSHVTCSSPSVVFDWEYCALSSPYFDLASCVAVNGLSQTDEASLCALYAQQMDLSLVDVLDNVSNMKPLVELTYKLWYQSARRAA